MVSRWYDIWAAACSVVAVCSVYDKDGSAVINCRSRITLRYSYIGLKTFNSHERCSRAWANIHKRGAWTLNDSILRSLSEKYFSHLQTFASRESNALSLFVNDCPTRNVP